ncbi:MAG: hypothetical protein WC284_07765 [Candidimonas sp.]
MNKNFNSILSELDTIVSERNKYSVVDARASHVINSCINLFKMIRENFSEEDAEKLQKRFFLAIKTENEQKFKNTIKMLKESNDV